MYKTSVHALVNGGITHKKQQISKKWYSSAVHWHLGNVMLVYRSFRSFWSFPTNSTAYEIFLCDNL